MTAQPLAGTENGFSPFWSPDSRFVGFFAGSALKKVDAVGGPPVTLCSPVGFGYGATWNRDGVIIFSDGTALHRVSASGGTPSLVAGPGQQGAGIYQ